MGSNSQETSHHQLRFIQFHTTTGAIPTANLTLYGPDSPQPCSRRIVLCMKTALGCKRRRRAMLPLPISPPLRERNTKSDNFLVLTVHTRIWRDSWWVVPQWNQLFFAHINTVMILSTTRKLCTRCVVFCCSLVPVILPIFFMVTSWTMNSRIYLARGWCQMNKFIKPGSHILCTRYCSQNKTKQNPIMSYLMSFIQCDAKQNNLDIIWELLWVKTAISRRLC